MQTQAKRLQFYLEHLLILACFLLVAVTFKKIWIDEYLGFAMASFDSYSEMKNLLWNSLSNINHGQTGFYFFYHFFALKYLGVNYFVLRLPSFLAYWLSLIFFRGLMEKMKVNALIRSPLILWLALSPWNFPVALEARPYILLQCATTALLYFLVACIEKGNSRNRIGLFVAGLFGFIVHPYFVIYLSLFIGLFFLLNGKFRELFRKAFSSKTGFFGVALMVIWAILFYKVGKFSWFRVLGDKASYDPYLYVGRDRYLAQIMWGTFFAPVGKPLFITLVVSSIAATILNKFKRVFVFESKTLNLTLIILLATIISQSILIYSTVSANYWILQRQWSAAFPLCFVLLAFVLQILLTGIKNLVALPKKPAFTPIISAACIFFVVLKIMSAQTISNEIKYNFAEYEYKMNHFPNSVDEIMDLADFNLRKERVVRGEFKKYYGR